MHIYFIIIISSKSPVIKQALKLLNTHGGEFDAAKVRGRKEEGREWRIVAAWKHACLFWVGSWAVAFAMGDQHGRGFPCAQYTQHNQCLSLLQNWAKFS